jgi:very-short-patch-repair endonuclease
VSEQELEQAVAQAERQNLPIDELSELMRRRPKRRGIALLRALLAGGPVPTLRSEAERQLLALIRRGRLAKPEVNAMLAGFEVDFLWRAERLVVEVDGFAFHSTRAHFERDHSRDAELIARGYTIMRVTWKQISKDSGATLVRLAQALVQPR